MFLKTLNPTQLEAATAPDGPLLILAGAGSGKTKVLTSRVAYLVMHRGVPAHSILAVTFTNKAAGEMRMRLESLMGDKARELWLGTFHSIGLRILRTERRSSGVNADLTVYNDDDQLSLVKQVMAELLLSEKSFAPRAMLSQINQAKNENITPESFLSMNEGGGFAAERAAKVYALYQKKLRQMNSMDFGDLICEPIKLLKQNANILKKYHDRFRHILVDEYQDTNRAQYLFTQMLAEGAGNLLAVGDPDQSIYAWRGACISNILEFEKDYPAATVLRLEQNYRSTKNILSAANSVIEKNKKRLKKELWTQNSDGQPVMFEEAGDEYAEARLIIRRIKSLFDEHRRYTYKDAAIFYRTNAQSRVFEEQLIREGIPYAIIGGTRFYDRLEIKDAIAYLRVAVNPADALSFQRAINRPARLVGKATLDRILALSAASGLTPYDALKDMLAGGQLTKTRAHEFVRAIDAFKKGCGLSDAPFLISSPFTGVEPPEGAQPLQGEGGVGGQRVINIHGLPLLENSGGSTNAHEAPDCAPQDNAGGGMEKEQLHRLTLKLLEESGYMRSLQEEGTEEAVERLENLFELIAAIKDFEHINPMAALSDFLDHVSLISDIDSFEDAPDRLTLMTLHSAKGLEFRAVFIAGMEEGLFPHTRSSDDEGELEEERRLCYVGMTRAKERLYLFAARSRTVYGQTKTQMRSRFIDEIDPARITIAESSERQAKPRFSSSEVYYTREDSQVKGGVTGELSSPRTQDGAQDGWRIGMKVKHPMFGIGVIKEKAGSGQDVKLTINFKDAGTRKLALKYASLTPIG
ncbi:MAG: UvrD-helicase domain-containing protein [Deltaproteobacteria bacterium]|nr:UvrD-helicase domain-containing protein [Deltaproteobacteria bacterium]